MFALVHIENDYDEDASATIIGAYTDARVAEQYRELLKLRHCYVQYIVLPVPTVDATPVELNDLTGDFTAMRDAIVSQRANEERRRNEKEDKRRAADMYNRRLRSAIAYTQELKRDMTDKDAMRERLLYYLSDHCDGDRQAENEIFGICMLELGQS